MSSDGLKLRQRRAAKVQNRLAVMTEAQLVDLIAEGEALGTGIGGARSLVVLDGVSLFVKLVPLTDLERLPANVRSTANLFGLPPGCNYGVGSPSFGVWREVAANSMTASWVASGACESFPMLHHWRVLDLPAFEGPLPDELGDIEAFVAYWHGSSAVRRRVEAIADSSAAVALFFEYVPRLLSADLDVRAGTGDVSAGTLRVVHNQLMAPITFMNAAGLVHFDTHFGNVLADWPDIYLTDLGLANSASFDLTDHEREFLETNRTHDIAFMTTRFLNWIVTTLGGVADRESRDQIIQRVADGEPANQLLPADAASIVDRFAPVASLINRFYEQLHGDDRNTPYPAPAVERAWSATQR